jgi:ribose/xylose/arabinose/galactoside ABC-type transport system permease subunit
MGITMMNVDNMHTPMFLNGFVLLGVVYLDQRRNRR